MRQNRRVRREKIRQRPLEQSVLLAFGCGSNRDSDVSPMIAQIVIGIVIAWFIIQGLTRLGEFLGKLSDDKNEKPGDRPE